MKVSKAPNVITRTIESFFECSYKKTKKTCVQRPSILINLFHFLT